MVEGGVDAVSRRVNTSELPSERGATRCRRRFAWFAVAWLAVGVAGCAGLAKADRSPTGGRSLELQRWLPAEQRCEYYTIDRNGVFGAAGGRAAELREITWTTPLTEAQIAEFLDPPSEASWWEVVRGECADAEANIGLKPPRTEFQFRGPTSTKQVDFRGEVPQIESMLKAMRAIAMGRFAPELDALPRAGERF